ncbi:NACHT, LRR and PYD domains-containing protein 12 [Haplochromis burtoni]|uniref:NACHT, LRR and PYD domains-containing protein 12 n=1 Tax=Haplochromis burtoni TaxID=8153 RepID=UPI0003BDA623|nr:NACHT, LRR and PYD domains-containing protein 12 [Haplochromis burtoni]XP_005948741.1 NACHT, LRR and PYD domains-containing protein 12 [Haplochromis burtoni]XP_042084172.1 NACHT, LRR and PYD domains-containing protein 12 [Haplochromis burtoni]XP_042084173.1 NACHT, LRR and PYD domains-containing protein 12 [Haplochromis burtoni]
MATPTELVEALEELGDSELKDFKEMETKDQVESLSSTDLGPEDVRCMPAAPPPQPETSYQVALQSELQNIFRCAQEALEKQNEERLYDVTPELFITERRTTDSQQEVRLADLESERAVKPSDLFQLFSSEGTAVRTVLTSGIAGIGKSSLVKKFLLDWAEKRTNQDLHLIFPFDCQQMGLWQGETFSLAELIHTCIPYFSASGIKEETLNDIFTSSQNSRDTSEFRLLFVFDGLDQSRLQLDFTGKTEKSTDVTKSVGVEVLLTNLIRGKLLPSARLWITTRPAAANRIPPQYVHRVTEVRGFTDPQKEDYFRKRFQDAEQANRMVAHINTSQGLHIMCHIPVFCWITAAVLEDVLKTSEGRELPNTLTEMYIHFLMVEINHTKQKHVPEKCIRYIMSLAELAFHQLLRGNAIFTEEELRCSGIHVRAASKYAGLFTKIFKQVCGQRKEQAQKNIFSFTHQSIHQFLAAVYVTISLFSHNRNVMPVPRLTVQSLFTCFSKSNSSTALNIQKNAVKTALKSPNGHLDLFARFLLGLSLQTNQTLLQDLLTQTRSSSHNNQKAILYVKKRIRKNPGPEQCILLFHCLNELNDRSLVEEIQRYLSSGSLCKDKLSPTQWSTLLFILLSSEKDLDVFDLQKYCASEEALLRLLPVIRTSRKLLLSGCKLSWRSCEALSSALSCQSSSLRELDMSNNDLQDSGVTLLSTGLRSPHCVLEILKLSGCMVTEEGCASLASALSTNPSHMRELDLSYNHPGDTAADVLSARLNDPNWRLDTLRLDHGGEQRLKPGLKKYACELQIDPNTASRALRLSHNNMTVTASDFQLYPNHPDRFDSWPQLLCENELSGRCYWEVEWRGLVDICVSYRGIKRKGNSPRSRFGGNDQSWSLSCFLDRYAVCHNNQGKEMYFPSSSSSSSSFSKRIAVYVDYPAGIVSFYRVSCDSLIHLHTFNTTFTEPLYAGFGCDSRLGFNLMFNIQSSVSLCKL